MPQDRLHGNETRAWPAQSDKAGQGGRNHDQFANGLTIGLPPQVKDQAQAQIGNEGKWMRRIKRLRRKDRKYLGFEMRTQLGLGVTFDVADRHNRHASLPK